MFFRRKLEHLYRHKKIIENYFFMTLLQALNSLFYILIYPYLIRTLGAEGYGLYIFATSVISYFIFFSSFGIDMPATKYIASANEDKLIYSKVLSKVFTTKIILQFISIIIFSILLIFVPFIRQNYWIFIFTFMQSFGHIFFPQWFYQGIQNMRVVTIIQLIFKFLSLPFIFYFIKKPNDIVIFAIINSLAFLLPAIAVSIMLRFSEKIKIEIVSISEVKDLLKECSPFFLSNAVGILKEQSVTIIIGAFFGMRDVAIYDLANKIIIIPRTILSSVNAAMFPKIITGVSNKKIKNIIKIEFLVGFLIIGGLVLFGKWIVLFLGGANMIQSYYLTIILSITVLSWLVVGAYISFVFIPNFKYFFVTRNQILAAASFAICVAVGLVLFKSIFVLAIAMAFSGIVEIIYCLYLSKKYKFL